MTAHESIWTVLLALLASASVVPAQAAPAQRPPDSEWGALDPARAARALASARAGGPAAAERALDGFAAAGVAERRLRARVLRAEHGPDQWLRILALTADPDAFVRTEIARALGRPGPTDALRAERVRELARLAGDDADASVRAASRTGLAALAATDELARLADRAPGVERAALLIALAGLPEAHEAARSRLRTDDDELVLAARLAAEGASGADEDEVLARIQAALARGSDGAEAALERYVRRLVQQGGEERALAALARLDDAVACALRARLALTRAGDPAAALTAARELVAAQSPSEGASDAARRRSRAARLSTCARIALGAEDTGLELAAARAEIRAQLALRADRAGPDTAAEHVALLDEAAQIELCDAVRVLAAASVTAAEPDASLVVDAAFALHRAALLAQAVATRAELSTADGLDRVLGDADSAVELVLDAEPSPQLDATRQIALRMALGRALATAAGPEIVGFEALPDVDVGTRNVRRLELLEEVLRADLERAQVRHARAALAVERARAERPGGAPAALQQAELESRLLLQSAWMDLGTLANGDETPLADQRSASWFALTTARRLREAGRGPEARVLLARAREDLDASGAAQRWLWGIELVAEIEAATGASYTDDEEPQRAEIELLRAVERLQALENLLRERGAPERVLELVRNQRANALVSLAVNANVRMGQPERALEHFEAAWALRQDEFLRVLLACYRARSGHAAEARAALATVAPGPGTYYNLACAWALLGERDTALRWLEKELRENHAPGGGLERQKAWARKDPDLASLRDDPRFQVLVGE